MMKPFRFGCSPFILHSANSVSRYRFTWANTCNCSQSIGSYFRRAPHNSICWSAFTASLNCWLRNKLLRFALGQKLQYSLESGKKSVLRHGANVFISLTHCVILAFVAMVEWYSSAWRCERALLNYKTVGKLQTRKVKSKQETASHYFHCQLSK